MQAIIMAAGMGNRIAPVSEGLPKCYLKLDGETLIERNLRLLRDAGIRECIIVDGHQSERLEADLSATDVRFAFNPFYQVANVLSSFWCGQPLLTEDFIFLHADTVFEPSILGDLVARAGEFVLAVDTKACGEEEMKYTLRDGRVDKVSKTMDAASCAGEFLGVCKVAGSVLPILRETSLDVLRRGEFGAFFEVAIQDLIDSDRCAITVMDVGDRRWREIDFPEDYAAARAMFES